MELFKKFCFISRFVMTNKCKRGILISKTPYEKRFAIMEDGELAALIVEGASSEQVLGNIYKGIVKKVVPSAKLAYVDIGLGMDGVLYQEDAVDRNASPNRRGGDDDDGEAFDEDAIEKVLREAEQAGVHGKNITPFMLAHIVEETGGESLATNMQLAYNNARTAAKIAVELAKLG